MKRRTFCASALVLTATGTGPFRRVLANATVPSEIAALGSDRKQITLRRSDVMKLRASLRGQLLLPQDDGYEQARRIWNGEFDRRPALIARCRGAADVIEAVHFARSHDLLTAVRAGGHSLSGQSVCDGGLMIDLSRMKDTRIDPATRAARVEAGVLLGDLDRQAQAFGLATTAGSVSHTGVAGLALGGGLGRLARKLGLACDNLNAMDVVTAEGKRLRADEQQNQDLFWAMRGGGGNFGIVTSFEFRLHPIGPMVLAGTLAFAFPNARATLAVLADFASNAPDELTISPGLARLPNGEPVIGADICYCGPIAQGERLLRPLYALGTPLIRPSPMRYVEAQSRTDAGYVHGRHYYFKSGFMRQVKPALIDLAVASFEATPSVRLLAFVHTGGAIAEKAPTATAYWNRDAMFDLTVHADWDDPSSSGAKIASVRALWRELEPFTKGYYINTDTPDDERRLQLTYGDNYPRLVKLKDKYDPTNLFRLNANIKPSKG